MILPFPIAELGYGAANINVIAQKAGISVGSLYSYFDSKEDMFLAMVEKGMAVLNQVLEDIRYKEDTVFEVIDRLFHMTVVYAKKHPDLCKLYLNLSTEQLAPMAKRLSEKMEVSFIHVYTEIFERAKEKGEVRKDLDVPLAAYYLDNLVISLQLSYASTYYKARLANYLGEDAMEDEERICNGLRQLVERSFR